MTVLQALKELKLIDSKIEKHKFNLNKYATSLSHENPIRQDQKEFCTGIVKAIVDNFERYIALKMIITYTNIHTTVNINGENMTAFDAVTLNNILRSTDKRKSLTHKLISSLNMNDAINLAQSRAMEHNNSRPQGEPPIDIKLFFDQSMIENIIEKYTNKFENISAALEMCAATTKLIMPPDEFWSERNLKKPTDIVVD